jgi:hypothetical protein
MLCFNHTECQCLYYKVGGNQKSSTADLSKLTQGTLFRSNPKDRDNYCRASHYYRRTYGFYWTGEDVLMRRHWPDIASNSICLVTEYTRRITVCTKVKGSSDMAVIPGYDWYHTVDPDLSAPQRLPDIPCRDKSCINYYRDPSSFTCR